MLSAMPSLVMSVGMLLGTVLWPVLTKLFEKRSRRKKKQSAGRSTGLILRRHVAALREECVRQRTILGENIVTLEDCIDRIRSTRRNLWERTYRHNDFLMLRLGIGSLPMDAEFRFPEKNSRWKTTLCRRSFYALCTGTHEIPFVPIALSLRDTPIVGIIGGREEACAYVRGLVLQISALHSYDEVKMVFLYGEREAAVWNFAKWLPHTWDAEQSVHFIASSPGDARGLRPAGAGVCGARST